MQQTKTPIGTPRRLVIVASLLLLAVLGAAFAFGGLGGGRPSFAAPPAGGPGPTLARLVLYGAPNGAGPVRKTFSASADNVIYVQMQWLNLTGTLHDAYLTFNSPDGAIYQVQDVVFSTTPLLGASQTIKRPGVLHPIAVQAATALTPGGYNVWGQLPVAGTWLGRLPGRWQLSVRLDDNPTVFGTQPFDLTR